MGSYKLVFKPYVGPMPGACELCDAYWMEADVRCVVGYIGEITARAICMDCADAIIVARGAKTPAERTAIAREAKAAKRAITSSDTANALIEATGGAN